MLQKLVQATYEWLGDFGDVLTAGGVLLGLACLVVAIAIYQRQTRAAQRNQEEIKAIMASHYEAFAKFAGLPDTPEIKAQVDRFAGASATSLAEYMASGTVKLFEYKDLWGKGSSSLWVSMGPTETDEDYTKPKS